MARSVDFSPRRRSRTNHLTKRRGGCKDPARLGTLEALKRSIEGSGRVDGEVDRSAPVECSFHIDLGVAYSSPPRQLTIHHRP
jgi:hypothetical protein